MSTTQKTSNQHQSSHSESESMLTGIQNSSQDCIRDYPISSTMLALGAGAAVGLIIASALSRREDERRSGYVSQLGNQIARAIGNVVPDSMSWYR